MKKAMPYVVIAVDHDEQQVFTDIMLASSRERALEKMLDNRENCCHGAAFTPQELRKLADDAERIRRNFLTLLKQRG